MVGAGRARPDQAVMIEDETTQIRKLSELVQFQMVKLGDHRNVEMQILTYGDVGVDVGEKRGNGSMQPNQVNQVSFWGTKLRGPTNPTCPGRRLDTTWVCTVVSGPSLLIAPGQPPRYT